MSDSALIVDQLRRAFDGDAWHGPSVLELLMNVNATTAASHPIAKAHSIWELVLHIEAWELAALRRFAGEVVELKEDFPPINDSSDTEWKTTLNRFKRTHNQLLTTITAMSHSHLTHQVPGKDYDFEFMFHGLAQHALYHAGQIAILKIAAAK